MILDLKGKQAVIVPVIPKQQQDGVYSALCTAAKMNEAISMMEILMSSHYKDPHIERVGGDEVDGKAVVRLLLSSGDDKVAIGSAHRRKMRTSRTSEEMIDIVALYLVDMQEQGELIIEHSDECDDYLPLNGPVAPYCECYHCGRQAEEHPSWVEQAEGYHNQGTGYEDNQAD